MSAFDWLKDIESLFNEQRYDLFVIDCGRKIESLLKESFKTYLESAPTSTKHISQIFLNSHRKSSFDKLTFGELIDLFEKTDILNTIYQDNARQYLFYLRIVKDIRNKKAHPNAEELKSETKADAYIVYGMILHLAKTIKIDQPTIKEVRREPKRIIMTPASPPDSEMIDPGIANTAKKIWVCKNKKSNKYFICLKEETDEKILLVTSENKIKSLQSKYFEPPVEEMEQHLLSAGLVTEGQIQTYHQYYEEEKEESYARQSTKRTPLRVPSSTANKITQDDLIPHIVHILEKYGGRLHKSEVEKKIYQLFEDIFKQPWYQETVSNGIPRWQHHIAWAKERAKKKGLIKSPNGSGRGYWELA